MSSEHKASDLWWAGLAAWCVSHSIGCFFPKSHCLPVLDYVWHSPWFFFFFSLRSRVNWNVLTLMCTWSRRGQHHVIKTSQEAERRVWGHDQCAPSSFWIRKESEKNQNGIKHHFFSHFHDFGGFILSSTMAIRRRLFRESAWAWPLCTAHLSRTCKYIKAVKGYVLANSFSYL